MPAISRVSALLAVTLALGACASDWRSNTTASSGTPSYNLAIPGTESSAAPAPTPKMEGDKQTSGAKAPAGG
jgi:hypothetical protein